MSKKNLVPSLTALSLALQTALAVAQSLPLPGTPTASTAGRTLEESRHQWRQGAKTLPAGAPNVLIIMLDDVGFAQADTVGGAIHTPTLQRVADTGIRYNAFHTTAISSATRAALLTGRNHHRVGSGTVTEFASDFDGYTGEIPKSSATVAEVLKQYGYSTALFGKWHSTSARATGPTGPFASWPTGYGFETFYGFMGAETDQYSPSLYRNTTPVEPPRDPKYHLTEDLAGEAVQWLRQRQALTPDKPFFMYWAPGAVHGPHQVFQSWSDKYKGRFDSGWDAYRQQAFQRQKAMGWIPKDTQLTPRPDTLPAWDSLSAEEKQFQARLMEVYAGFLEHTDTQAGRLIDELEREGIRDNTLILYVLSDNGASSEGRAGTINELVNINMIPTTATQQMQVLQSQYGGLAALGGPKLSNMYHAAWAWAGESPFVGTKLSAGYFGGTRTPLAISWPRAIVADKAVRPQFHHVNDIVPTLYDILGLTPPPSVNGVAQQPLDGVSMRYSFADAGAPGRKGAQYFEMMGSRGVYEDGWMASVFGPVTPWIGPGPQLAAWHPDQDRWTLHKLGDDYSQAVDVSGQHPERLAQLRRRFEEQAAANQVYPLGASFFPFLHPEARIGSTRSEWRFDAQTQRLPEIIAPNLRSRDSVVTVRAELPAQASGVLYSLGGASGGVTLYAKDGHLVYEYNAVGFARTRLRSSGPVAAGSHRIEVETAMLASKPGSPARLTLRVDGLELASGTTPFTPPLLFTATGSFNVGRNLGSPVSLDYFDAAPFAFNGTITDVHVVYKAAAK
ncbi:arylsulfatase [Pelomonas sp. SE-A7]|uniref:arylsulfatase n=1 Tax=Pelomonas sp. SE-A7 TaxID=3054953 RepID=UPI00259CDC35|nr:arylsulfatase [Pelomonas sp. SE-A7]MDM4764776.1 arylsulfatase [Pelomonas sp. SE-A7]